ncbi:Microcystin dependent protein [Paenibacillus pasadenensis]|uniref:Microcystin dependent protein n=2 Tax=Paenibacillus TaxID=44249 RepID=A0A2N5NCT6_9BACL|nr:Microcystin dependent protein [Paenibacillus pasadenensis]
MPALLRRTLVLAMAVLIALGGGLLPAPPKANAASGIEPMLGQVALFATDFAPRGWTYCDGRLLSIQSNTALFSLLGTNYGGDGKSTFALPDLRDEDPMGGVGYYIAVRGAFPNRDETADMPGQIGVNIGEAVLFAGSFAPGGFLSANGGTLAIREHSALYSLVGTTYGGDGSSTFALPNVADVDGVKVLVAHKGGFPDPQVSTYPQELAYMGMVSMHAGAARWPQAVGQTIQISENEALFSVLYARFGGDGIRIFQLPDLRGKLPFPAYLAETGIYPVREGGLRAAGGRRQLQL